MVLRVRRRRIVEGRSCLLDAFWRVRDERAGLAGGRSAGVGGPERPRNRRADRVVDRGRERWKIWDDGRHLRERRRARAEQGEILKIVVAVVEARCGRGVRVGDRGGFHEHRAQDDDEDEQERGGESVLGPSLPHVAG